MTEITAVEKNRTIEDTLADLETNYIKAFNEVALPAIENITKFTPKGHLTAVAQATKSGISLTIGFEYDEKNPDNFEMAQRYIFNEMLNRMVLSNPS